MNNPISLIDNELEASFIHDLQSYWNSDRYKIRAAVYGAIEHKHYYDHMYGNASHDHEETVAIIKGEYHE